MAQGLAARLAVASVLICSVGRAQSSAEPSLGDTAWALPGIERVAVPATAGRRFSAAATAGYGYTEALGDQDGANHRLVGIVAVAGAPARWLELGLRLDGRFNSHPADEFGSDDNLVGDPRLTVRVGERLADALHLGVELVGWLPGEDAPSFPVSATSLDARGLVAWAPAGSGFTLAAMGGWRLDNSAATVDDTRTLRVGDRSALGVSEFDAVLAGLGAAQRVGGLELLGEVTADAALGSGAPPLVRSPLRATLGARYSLSPSFQVAGGADLSLSGRPGIDASDPLVPVEPRVTVLVGLRYRLGLEPPARALPPPEPARPRGPSPPPQPPSTAEPPPPPGPVTGDVTGTVTDEAGRPIAGAYVTVKVGETEANVDTDATGRFKLEGMVVGEAEVAVEAEGFDPTRQPATIAEGRPSKLDFVLLPALPAGQLRGLIRSFGGTPLAATVRVEPGTVEVECDADGRFEVDMPPGSYTLTITAEGHVTQRRQVKVDNRGVTIINADLKEGRW